MPPREKHTKQAGHNCELLRFMGGQNKQTEFSDWYVTIAFYAALHYFEAMLSAVKPSVTVGGLRMSIEHSGALSALYIKHSEHQIRKKLIKANFPRLYNPYISLYEMSRTARYDCHAPAAHNWADAEFYLDDVKMGCETLMSKKRDRRP